jgi:hypothetical protein
LIQERTDAQAPCLPACNGSYSATLSRDPAVYLLVPLISLVVADLPEKKDVVCGIGGNLGLRCSALQMDGDGNDLDKQVRREPCGCVPFSCACPRLFPAPSAAVLMLLAVLDAVLSARFCVAPSTARAFRRCSCELRERHRGQDVSRERLPAVREVRLRGRALCKPVGWLRHFRAGGRGHAARCKC